MKREFLMRRLHSLAGIAFLLFLVEHLFTNSQATLFLGDDGKGFIDQVNWIHSLPYLQVIEFSFIGLPLALHVWFGIERIHMAKINSIPSDGTAPSLPLNRNIAFTWQRITSVLLIVGIGVHVYYMRFVKQPENVTYGVHNHFFVKLGVDSGLYTVAPRLDLMLFDKKMIDDAEAHLNEQSIQNPKGALFNAPFYNRQLADTVKEERSLELEKELFHTMKGLNPAKNQVVAHTTSFGTAILMMLRDTYKSVWMCVLYSFFVVIACFHACNGLWTFAITWGVTLSERSRVVVRLFSNLLMTLLIFFGMACIWGVYWINLRY